MADILRWVEKLRGDLLEQWKGKDNLAVKHRALARQFAELTEFFEQLLILRTLENAQGAQLDGIGDIVAMTRMDALAIAIDEDQAVPMDDATYRKYLAYKMLLNTNTCTHADIYKALRMFWRGGTLKYREDVNHPATMFISAYTIAGQNDAGSLFNAPKVKPAGVKLVMEITTETPLDPKMLYIKGIGFNAIMSTALPAYSE